jgi:hypothetical protein
VARPIMSAQHDESIIKSLFSFQLFSLTPNYHKENLCFLNHHFLMGTFSSSSAGARDAQSNKRRKEERTERNEMCKSCERKLNTNCDDIWEAMERRSTRWRLLFVPHFGLQTTTNFSPMSHNFNFCRNLKI